ncbi:hypothetical protein SAMN05216262_1472 [Colwellia chukchiensis]|uniref:DUF4476 domain-containing protein n=1 Tax=Colwellia chukchiensis TaxID=641665 RepID=A0A1H7UJH9_9GAMM|nr:hypothetical protein [Colwellia chukchiensis]SEL96808.1 hypothetical protein SAMN05216262_1472 [Colwellia chukchiensis]
MKKGFISTLALSLILLSSLPSYAGDDDKLSKQIKKIEKEFKEGNFSNVETYGNIITLCNATPKSGVEFDSWAVKHANDENLDLSSMRIQVKECDKITKKGYRELEDLYKTAYASGEKVSALLLARLIPYVSPDKVELLQVAAAWSEEGADLLGKLMLDNELDFSSPQRKFWINVSNMSIFYPEEYTQADNQLLSLVDGVDMSAIEGLIAQWQDATVEERENIVNLLKEL